MRVRATSVNPIDWKIRSGALRLFIRHSLPIILGVDVAGEVAEQGEGATRFAVGTPVFAMCPDDLGANAKPWPFPESVVVSKPKNLSMEEAASVPAVALTALQALRDLGHLEANKHVLVNGASGGVGIFTVQLAKAMGATVTGVCSERNAELVKSLGADSVIDYKTTDFAEQSALYNVVFDCVGSAASATAKKC